MGAYPYNKFSEACAEPGAVLLVQDVHWPIENFRELARHLHFLHDGQNMRHEEVIVVVRFVKTKGEVLRG